MADQFASVNLTTFFNDNENKNTLAKTLGHVRLFQEFIKTKYGVSTAIHQISPAELNKYVAVFVVSVRKADGGEYEPSYIRGFVSSFDRQLKRHRYGTQIISNDILFSEAREALRMKQRDLKGRAPREVNR